jgi:hypothetical protein
MVTSSQLLSHTKAQRFRAFRLHMASGQEFDIRHPEMMKVGTNFVLVFSYADTKPELIEQWNTVSMMLIESISHLDSAVSS